MELGTWGFGVEHPLGLHLVDRGEGEVGIDRSRAIAGQRGEMVHLAGLTRLHDQAAHRAGALADEVMVDGSRRQ